MPRQIVHIGLKKTGTTWLQDILLKASADGLIGAMPFENWRAFRTAHPWKNAGPDDFDALAELLAPFKDKPAILSWELMHHYDWQSLDEAIARALPEAIILVTTRGPESFLQSNYNNAVINGFSGQTNTFSRQFQKSLLKTHDFCRMAEEFERHSNDGRLVFLPFEMLADKPRKYLKCISDLVGIDLSAYFARRSLNASPPADLLDLLKKVSAKLDDEQSGLLDTREWYLFKYMAMHAAGYAEELQDYFRRNAAADGIELDNTLPTVSDDMKARLADRMSILSDLKVFNEYRSLYYLLEGETTQAVTS